MRLVDADAFKRQVVAAALTGNLSVEKGNAMCELIDKQPTAYDVDKVLERMEMESQNIELIYQTDQGLDYEDAIGIDIINAKQIVKSGGIE